MRNITKTYTNVVITETVANVAGTPTPLFTVTYDNMGNVPAYVTFDKARAEKRLAKWNGRHEEALTKITVRDAKTEAREAQKAILAEKAKAEKEVIEAKKVAMKAIKDAEVARIAAENAAKVASAPVVERPATTAVAKKPRGRGKKSETVETPSVTLEVDSTAPKTAVPDLSDTSLIPVAATQDDIADALKDLGTTVESKA